VPCSRPCPTHLKRGEEAITFAAIQRTSGVNEAPDQSGSENFSSEGSFFCDIPYKLPIAPFIAKDSKLPNAVMS